MDSKIITALEHGIGFDWDRYSLELLNNKYSEENLLIDEICTKLHCNQNDVKDFKRLIWKLYANKIFPESLSLEYLKNNRNTNEIYELLYQYKRLQIFLNQYATKLQQQIHNGRIYADWTIDGAKTGRMTCKNPNLQAFPKELKQYFKPSKGNCFVSGDYSQIELRILAELSKDKNLIAVLANGNDIHSNTASNIFDKPLEMITEEERTIGKRVNFGMCYGISAHGLCKTINKHTTNKIILQQADLMKQHFYDTYPEVKKYHNYLLTTDSIKSLEGREWTNYPKGIGRINLPVQASAAEGLKLALSLFLEHMPKECLLVNVIHDEIIVEAPTEQVEQVTSLLKKYMVKGMEQLITAVPVVVDIDIKK